MKLVLRISLNLQDLGFSQRC